MIRSDLPLVPLADLPGGPEPQVLCATARLATGLRRAHGELQAARGAGTWRALQSSTPAMWLDQLVSSALLRGEIPAAGMPGSFLSRSQERSVWEQAIAADAGAAAELFDREGMALAAMEAASLQRTWGIAVPEALHTAEYLAFLRWQARVAGVCKAGNWQTADEALAWRIDCLARGIGGLPARLGIAGFIAADPLVSRLLVVLESRGVELFRLDFGRGESAPAVAVALPDAEAECLAAAGWAADQLRRNASLRLRIAVADLPARKRMLESALDDALHPSAVGAGWAAMDRSYAFAAGAPLADESPVDVALRLLRLSVHPQRVAQAEFGALLCAGGWSADLDEADARARVEAGLRERLPPETSLERLMRAVTRQAEELPAPRLVADLGALLETMRRAPRRQLPSLWAAEFGKRLEALGWPGQRVLLAAEAAACDDFRAALGAMQALDAILGRVDAGEALRQLQRQCRDQAFAAPRGASASVEVCSLADALGGAVDALWVMGLNEAAWPPPARPNPLLPADLQRRAGIPAARTDSLAAEAASLQAFWRESAAEVVFSWAEREGERPLPVSPLLADIPRHELPVVPAAALRGGNCPLERIDDSRAPPVGAAGTPARRHGAAEGAGGVSGLGLLPVPARRRRVASADFRPRCARARLAAACGAGVVLARPCAGRPDANGRRHARRGNPARGRRMRWRSSTAAQPEPLPPRLRQLEDERLQALLAVWLDVEAQRLPFRVIACEERHELDIEGLPVRVVIDRIDQLDDGRLVVIDYKSGRSDSVDSWADPRITRAAIADLRRAGLSRPRGRGGGAGPRHLRRPPRFSASAKATVSCPA